MEVKEIVQRSAQNGEIHYTIDEMIFLIKEYIKDKKGYYPPDFGIGRGMLEGTLLHWAFSSALEHFTEKHRNE